MMAVFFLDTSAVVKRYIQEAGTAWVQATTDPSGGSICFVAGITLPEVVSAITRRERGGHLSPADATTALADFRLDFARQYRVVGVSAVLLDQAAVLARTHALRGYDAVQLAAALVVRGQAPSLTLLSADAALNSAALAELLAVDDPNAHP